MHARSLPGSAARSKKEAESFEQERPVGDLLAPPPIDQLDNSNGFREAGLMDLRTVLGWAYLASPMALFLLFCFWVILWPPKSWADRTPGARARRKAAAAETADHQAQQSSEGERI
jgi:hypothetical protein